MNTFLNYDTFDIHLIPSLMDYTRNYIYYLVDKENNFGIIIDPGEDQPVIKFLQEGASNLAAPKYILNTHHHWDHVNGNLNLKNHYALEIIASKSDAHRIPGVDKQVEYDEFLQIGIFNFEIIHTPGHTYNHIAFYDKSHNLLFCGDTMFSGGCGGIFEGTPQDLFISFEKFNALPDDTIVCPAHEYTISNLKFCTSLEPENNFIKDYALQMREKVKNGHPTLPTTIAIEKQINPFIKFDNCDLRKTLKIVPSESNLHSFLKIVSAKNNYYNSGN